MLFLVTLSTFTDFLTVMLCVMFVRKIKLLPSAYNWDMCEAIQACCLPLGFVRKTASTKQKKMKMNRNRKWNKKWNKSKFELCLEDVKLRTNIEVKLKHCLKTVAPSPSVTEICLARNDSNTAVPCPCDHIGPLPHLPPHETNVPVLAKSGVLSISFCTKHKTR